MGAAALRTDIATGEPQALLTALESLAHLLPGRAPASRRRLYQAIEVLVMELVAQLERLPVTEEAPYLLLGHVLDACRRSAATGSPAGAADLDEPLRLVAAALEGIQLISPTAPRR